MPARMLGNLLCLLALLLLLPPSGARAEDADTRPPAVSQVPVYVFFSTTCPHCAKALGFLTKLSAREPRMRLVPFVLSNDERHDSLFAEISKTYEIDPPAVPLILVGDAVFVGYGENSTSARWSRPGRPDSWIRRGRGDGRWRRRVARGAPRTPRRESLGVPQQRSTGA